MIPDDSATCGVEEHGSNGTQGEQGSASKGCVTRNWDALGVGLVGEAVLNTGMN